MPVVNEGKNLRIDVKHQFIAAISVGLDGRSEGRFDGIHYGSKDRKFVEIAFLMKETGALCAEPIYPFQEYFDGMVYAYVPSALVNEWIIKNGGKEVITVESQPSALIGLEKELA